MAKLSKRPKLCQTAGEDRMSKLPESVRGHILSFLPTKDSVRTSILSKTWRHTWTSVAVLDFEDSNYPKKKRVAKMKSFVNFVNRVLILRSHPCVKRFKLNLINEYHSSDVDSWILAAITHDVEEVDLSMKGMGQLPKAIFCCGTLVVLKLSKIDLKVPQSVCLTNLKLLHLKKIQSLSDGSIEKLLSGSPLLEDFVIKNPCGTKSVSVKSSSLKSFFLKDSMINMDRYKVFVDAPKLKFLDLVGRTFEDCDFKIENSDSLVEATLDFGSCYDYNVSQRSHQIVHLLLKIKSVKVIRLSPLILKAWVDRSYHQCFRFYRVTNMELKCCGNELSILPDILATFPKLKVCILINKVCIHTVAPKASKEKTEIMCLQYSLEELEFKGFGGSEGEMHIVEYFMQNAKLLKEIRISTYCSDYRMENDLLKKLLRLPRGSYTCPITVF